MLPASIADCTVGVLEYTKFSDQLLPLVDRASNRADLTAVEELRALVMGITDAARRVEILAQLDRIDVAVQSGRWHPSAAGLVLQGVCVPEAVTVEDRMSSLTAFTEVLYDWNADHAEEIATFFGFLSDRTLPWCSPSDTWRAVLPPAELKAPAEALGALSPRQLRKMLIDAEDGDVCSEDEARAMGAWWEAIRTALRQGTRTGEGLFIAVAHRE